MAPLLQLTIPVFRQKLARDIRDVYSQLIYEYTESDAYFTVYQSIHKARTVPIVRRLLTEVESLSSNGTITLKELLELKAVAFGQLQAITGYKLAETQTLITNELLPLCLQEDSNLRLQYRAFRNILSEWMDQHAQSDFAEIRNAVVSILVPLIGGESHAAACWTLAHIGYGRQDVIQALLAFAVTANNEAGDVALSALTEFGLSGDERSVILGAIHKRAQERCNTYLLSAAARLSDASSFPVIVANWLSPAGRAAKQADASMAFTVIREIADAHDSDHALQDTIWTESAKVVEQDPKALYWDFAVGHVLTSCDCPQAIPTLMAWHGQHPDWFENPNGQRSLMEGDVEDCVKPRQLEGWSQVGDNPVLAALRNDACVNTGFDGFARSFEQITKEKAWRTLLRLGHQEALNWFDPAVTGEDGKFVRAGLMDLLEPVMNFCWMTHFQAFCLCAIYSGAREEAYK